MASSSQGDLWRSKLAADLVFQGLLSQQCPCWVQPHWEDSSSHSPIRKGSLSPKGQDRRTYSLFVYILWTAAASKTVSVAYLSQQVSFLPLVAGIFPKQMCTVCWCQKHTRVCKAVKELKESIRLLGSHPEREN